MVKCKCKEWISEIDWIIRCEIYFRRQGFVHNSIVMVYCPWCGGKLGEGDGNWEDGENGKPDVKGGL